MEEVEKMRMFIRILFLCQRLVIHRECNASCASSRISRRYTTPPTLHRPWLRQSLPKSPPKQSAGHKVACLLIVEDTVKIVQGGAVVLVKVISK